MLAYWKTEAGVVAMRLRCLHDDYDYSSAGIFTVQDKGDILGAVVFATDRGDTHISLDRIKDATIKAKDLRVRLEFEGAVARMQLPLTSSGQIEIKFEIAHAVFDDYPVKMEVGRDDKTARRDVVLYHGPEKDFNFAEMAEAVVIFTLSLSTRPGSTPDNQLSITTDQSIRQTCRIANWSRPGSPDMSLTVPAKPLPTSRQKAAASAKFGSINPWKTTAESRLEMQ